MKVQDQVKLEVTKSHESIKYLDKKLVSEKASNIESIVNKPDETINEFSRTWDERINLLTHKLTDGKS